MPALPALLLSIHFLFLLLTMAPHSFSQAPAMSAVKMGECGDEFWTLSFYRLFFFTFLSLYFTLTFLLILLSTPFHLFFCLVVFLFLHLPDSLSLLMLHTECLSFSP